LGFNWLRGVEKDKFFTGVTNSASVAIESLPLYSIVLLLVSDKNSNNYLLCSI